MSATTVQYGPITYVVENPTAARILQEAGRLWRERNLNRANTLRTISARIEDGNLDPEDGLRVAELV